MRRDFNDTYKTWRNNLVEELGGTYSPSDIIAYSDWLYERANNLDAMKQLSSTPIDDPMKASIVDAFQKRAQKIVDDRLSTYEDERYQMAVERMLQLSPEQRSIIHSNIDINRMTPEKIERLNRLIDDAGAVRVVGADEAPELATGSRGLQWGNPLTQQVQYTQDVAATDPIAQKNNAGYTSYSKPVTRDETQMDFREITKQAMTYQGGFGLQPVGQTVDSFNRPVVRFQQKLSEKQKQAGETPRMVDFSYEQTTGNWFVGQADSSKQFVVRPALGVQATANPALGSDDQYPNLEPGLRQGVGNVLEAIIAGKGSLGKPFKRHYKNNTPTAWTEEYGSLESVDIHQATAAEVADLGSRWSVSKPDVGALEPEVMEKLVKELNTSVGSDNRFSVADYRKGYLQDNDTRLRYGRGYMLTGTNEPIDISTGSTKDFRRNFRGAAKGVGPATGVMFNDPAADNDGLFTTRIKASDRTYSRGQRVNTAILDTRAVFGEGEYLAQGGLIQNRKTIPLWDYKGKSLDALPVKSGQLFSRPGHRVDAIAEGLDYAGDYDKGGTLGGLSGFRAGSAVETLIENIQMREYKMKDGTTHQVPVMSVVQSSPMTVGEYKPAPGFKGSGSPTNERNPIFRGLENTFGERPQVAIPVSSKRERLDSQALLAFESVGELETVSKYMLQAARSIKQEDGSRKYEDDALSSLLHYTDRQGNVVGNLLNTDKELEANAFGVQYDPHASDIFLQASRMYMKDNLQKVPIQGARVSEEDMQGWIDALRERGARRFNAHWENKLGKGWEDNLTGAEQEKYSAWREKSMQSEVDKTLRNIREITQPGGHKMYSVDAHAYAYQGQIMADMLDVNIGGSAKMSPDYFNALSQTQPDVAATLERQLQGDVLKMTSAATMMTTFRANMFDENGLTEASREVRENIKKIDASMIDIEAEEARTRVELGEGATQAVIEKMTLERLAQKHKNNYVQMGNIMMMPLSAMNNQYEVDDLGSAPKNAATTGYAALKSYIANTKKMGTGDADDGTLWQQIQTTGEEYLQTLGERIQEVGTRKQATRFQFAAPGGPSSMIMGLPHEMKVLDEKSARKYINRLAKDQAQQAGDDDVKKYETEIWKKFQTEGLWGVSSMSSANREQMWQRSHFVSDSWLRGDKYHALQAKLDNELDGRKRKRIQNQMGKIESQWAELGYDKEFFQQFRDVEVAEGTARSAPSFIRGQNKDADGDPVGQHIMTLLDKNSIYDPTHGDPVGAAGRAVGDEYGATVPKYGISMPEWLQQNIDSGKPVKYLDKDKSAKSYMDGTYATRDMSSTFQPYVRNMFAGMLLGSRMAGVSKEQEEHIRGAADSGTAIYQWAMDKNLLQSAASETLMYGSKEMSLQSSKQGLYPVFHGQHYKSVYPEGNFQKGYAVSGEEFMFDMLATHAMHRGGVGSEDDKAAWYGSEASGNKGLADVQATMLTRFKDAGNADVEARVKGALTELFESGADAGLSKNKESGKYDFKSLTSDQRTKVLSAITGQEYQNDAEAKKALQDYLYGSDMGGMSPASFWLSAEVMRNTAERAETKNANSRYYGDIIEGADRNNVGGLIGKFFGASGRYTVAKNAWAKEYGAAGDDLAKRKTIYEQRQQAFEQGEGKAPMPYTKAPEAPVWPYVREGVQHFIKGSSGKLASIGNAFLAANQVNYGAADPEELLQTANKLSSSGLRGVFSGMQAPIQKALGGSNPIMKDAKTAKGLAEIMDATKAHLQGVGIVPKPAPKSVAATGKEPDFNIDDINAMMSMYSNEDYDFMADGGKLGDEVTFVGEAGMEAIVKDGSGGFNVIDANTTKALFGNKTAAEMKGKLGGKYKADGGNLDDDEEVDPFHFDPSINYWSGYDTGMSREAWYLSQFTGINPEWIPKREGSKLVGKEDVERYMARREEKDPKNAKYKAGLDRYHDLIGQMPRKAVVGKRQQQWKQAEAAISGQGAPMPRDITFNVGDNKVTRGMSEDELEAITAHFGKLMGGKGGLNVELQPFSASQLGQATTDFAAYLDLSEQRSTIQRESGVDPLEDPEFAKKFLASSNKVASVAGRALFMKNKLGLSYDQMTSNPEQGKILQKLMGGYKLDDLKRDTNLNPVLTQSLEDAYGERENRQLPGMEDFFRPQHRMDISKASSTVAVQSNNEAIAGIMNQQGEGIKQFQRELIQGYTQVSEETGKSALDSLKENLSQTIGDISQGKPTEMQSKSLFEAKKILDAAKNVGKDEAVPFNIPELEQLVSTAETFGISAQRPDFDPEKLGKAKAAKQLLGERFSGDDIRNAVAAVQGGAGDHEMLGKMEEAYKLIQTAKAGGLDLGDEFGHTTQQSLAYGIEYGKAQDYKPAAKLDQVEGAIPGLKGAMTALQQYQGVLSSMEDTLPELTSEQKRNVTVMQQALRVHDEYSKVMATVKDDTSDAAQGIRDALEPFGAMMEDIGKNRANFEGQIEQYRTSQSMMKGTAQDKELQEAELTALLQKRGFTGTRARSEDRYEELAREGIEFGFGRFKGKLGGEKGTMGREALEAYGGAMRGISSLQGAMFSTMMARNQLIQPMTDLADKYQKQAINRDMSVLGAGFGSYDDMLGSEYGAIKRRGARRELAEGAAGQEIYRMYGGAINMGANQSIAAGAGSALGGIAPALAAGMIGKSVLSPGWGLAIGAATYGASQLASGMSVHNNENAIADKFYRSQAALRDGGIGGQIGDALWATVTDFGGQIGAMTSSQEERDRAMEIARERLDARDFFRGGTGNMRDYFRQNATDANMTRGLSLQFQTEAADQFGMGTQEANEALQYQLIYGGSLPTQAGNPMYATGQMSRWGTYGININEMSRNIAQAQGTLSANAGGVGAAWGSLDQYLTEISDPNNRYGTTIGEEGIRIQNSMQRTGQMNSMLAQAGLETMDWDYYTSRGDGRRRRDDIYAQDTEMRILQTRANTALYNDQFADRSGQYYQDLATGYLNGGDLRGTNRISQQYQQAGGFFQQYAMMLGADNTGDAARQLASLSQLESDQFDLASGVLSGNPYAASAAYQQARARGETTGLGSGMYNLVDLQTGLNPYQQNIDAAEAATLRQFDYGGWLENKDLEGLSPIKMQREMAQIQYAQQDRQYTVGRQMDYASFALQTGGEMAIRPVSSPDESMQGFIDQLEPAAEGLEMVAKVFKDFGFEFDKGDGRGYRQLEDDTKDIQRGRERRDWERQEESLGMSEEGMQLRWSQFFENLGFSKEKFGYQTQYERGNMQLDRQMQLNQRQWRMEDMSFARSKAEIGFGWQMEDFDLNLRYARGRQRRDLMRQQERAVISHGMDMAKMDRDEQRQDVTNTFDDTKFERALANFNKMNEFQIRAFDMQEKHFREQYDLDMRQHEMNKQRFAEEKMAQEQMWAIEDQRRLLERQFQDAQFAITQKLNEEAHAAQVSLREMGDILRGIAEAYGNQQAKFQASRQTLEALSDVYTSLGGQYTEFTYQVTGKTAEMGQGLAVNVQGMVRTVSDGATNIFNAIAGIFTQLQSLSSSSSSSSSSSNKNYDKTYSEKFAEQYGKPGSGGGGGGEFSKAEGGYIGTMRDLQQNAPTYSYADGGYTGDGGKYEVAGRGSIEAHKGEYIVPQRGVPVVRGDNPQTVEELRRIRTAMEKLVSMGVYNINATINTRDGSVRSRDVASIKDEVYRN